jgi:hypothetical protein
MLSESNNISALYCFAVAPASVLAWGSTLLRVATNQHLDAGFML